MAKAPKTLDRPIAWVCRTYESSGKTEVEVTRRGMTREEIREAFPPHWNSRRAGKVYNRKALLKAIIYEAYREVVQEGQARHRDNIRGFWYERLFYTLMNVMGEGGDPDNQASIDAAVNEAWRELIEGGWVTYEALNLYSEKENLYHVSVCEDSPYPTTMVLVEKASLYEDLRDIADTYEVSFCCTGGQNSRAAAMAYASRLEALGVDLWQDFTVYSFCDFDPEGWDIPLSFIDHLSLKVHGGINLVRLGVLREQLGESVIRHQAIPYSLDTRTERGQKSKITKYERFMAETGGLFIPGPRDGEVPARVELNIYTPSQIRERILQGLSEHIDGFPYQIRKLKETIADQHDQAWSEYCSQFYDDVSEVYEPYYEAIDRAKEGLATERARRAPEVRQRKRELLQEIEQLDERIEAETADIQKQENALSRLRRRLYDEAGDKNVLDHIPDDFPGPDDLITDIDDNGGWRQWAEELGVETLDGDTLADAARRHSDFDWQPRGEERNRIRRWILGQFPLMYGVSGPDEEPDEMVEETLCDALH